MLDGEGEGGRDEITFFTTNLKCNEVNTPITSFPLPGAGSWTPSGGPSAQAPTAPGSWELSAAGARRDLTATDFCITTNTLTTLNQPELGLKLPLPFFNQVSLERTVLRVVLA